MGKGTITSALGAGRYNLTVNYARTAIESRIDALTVKINAASVTSAAADALVVEKQAAYAAAQAALDVQIAIAQEIIRTASPMTPENEAALLASLDALTEATAASLEAEAALASARFAANLATLDYISLYKDRQQLLDVPDDFSIQAWCVDYNAALTGEVGTIEVNGQESDPGETDKNFWIVPGGADGTGAAYSAATHGQLMPVLAMSPAETFYNAAMRPGWQKWQPTYRRGTITEITPDGENTTCAVEFADDYSTEHNGDLEINQDDSITCIFDYMDCDYRAFSVGDNVIVRFTGQDWSSGVVIGFQENPKQCAMQVKITVTAVAGDDSFVTLANQRISSIQAESAWADYAHNVWNPAFFAALDGLEGQVKTTAYGMVWQRWDAETIASVKEPYLAWDETRLGANQNLGYGSYIASANTAVSNWNAAKTAQASLLSSTKGSNSGCINPADDVTAAALTSFVLTIDCDYGEPISEIIDITSTTPLQDNITISNVVKAKWATLNDDTSPVCSTSLFVTGLISFSWEGRGYIDTDGVFYYFTRNHLLTATGGARVPEDLSITITVDGGRAIFKYPSEADYAVNVWSLGTVGEDIETSMVVDISGRAKPSSTLYGVSYEFLVSPGGAHYFVLTYSSDPYAWIYRDRELISRGYTDFAGMYYDHPIITRVDVTDVGAELDTVANVLAQIEADFTYADDEESFDAWSFMNNKNATGDCEDFAITTIQRMLDAGFSISRLKLAMGWKLVDGNPRGHAWVLLDDVTVLDRTVKSISDMNEYNVDRMLQIDGENFLNESDGSLYTFKIREWEDFAATVFTMTCNLTRNISATPSP